MTTTKVIRKTSGRKPVRRGQVCGDAGVTEDRIRARAYEIYVRRGDGPGDALSDWLQAEQELRNGRNAT